MHNERKSRFNREGIYILKRQRFGFCEEVRKIGRDEHIARLAMIMGGADTVSCTGAGGVGERAENSKMSDRTRGLKRLWAKVRICISRPRNPG